MSGPEAVIGVDVGTGSARAGIFAGDGAMLGKGEQAISLWRSGADFVEQSSTEIWAAVIAAVAQAREMAGECTVRGIGFDATCSLVVLGEAGAPLAVGADEGAGGQDPIRDVPIRDVPIRDVIVWMDHRALAEAAEINATEHPVLRYLGGRISPEMQTPKLLWLSRHRPESFAKARHFFDLPDFLTWRATGHSSRSLCSLSCKWTYLGHQRRWDESYFRAIGLGALADEGFRRIGTDVRAPGVPVGRGLTAAAAAELGLSAGTPVGTSAIDAHAGGIGLIGAALEGQPVDQAGITRRLALIGGTSSCHMAVSAEPAFVPGVWGPYWGAMLPGLWLNEGGQSATGALIDHLVRTHAAYPALAANAQASGRSIYEVLNARLEMLAAGQDPARLTSGLHVFPDFHGNRSPRADPSLTGMISGLTLAAGPDELATLYLAAIQAIAYGTRHIVEIMNSAGYAIDFVLATGGGSRNPLFLESHADALGTPVAIGHEPEAVLLGAAILGAVAGAIYPGISAAMTAMSRVGRVIKPRGGATARYHAAKYAVFQRLFADQMAYRALMEDAGRDVREFG
ncbi:MAG: FGGY-family carbohydrate kinase [Acetobacteraceae bacterium]